MYMCKHEMVNSGNVYFLSSMSHRFQTVIRWTPRAPAVQHRIAGIAARSQVLPKKKRTVG